MGLLAKNEAEQLAIDQAGTIEELRHEIGRLRAALKRCADKLERCAIAGGTTPEYAAIAVEEFRALAETTRHARG